MSWPAMIAFSTAGITLSEKPTIPGRIPRPAPRRSSRLARSSSLTVRLVQPEARSSPRVAGSAAGSRGRVTGAERTTGLVGPSNTPPRIVVRSRTGRWSRRLGVRRCFCGGHGDRFRRKAAQADLAVADARRPPAHPEIGDQLDACGPARPLRQEANRVGTDVDGHPGPSGRLDAGPEHRPEAAGGWGGRSVLHLERDEPHASTDRVLLRRSGGPVVRRPLRCRGVVLDQERRRWRDLRRPSEAPADVPSIRPRALAIDRAGEPGRLRRPAKVRFEVVDGHRPGRESATPLERRQQRWSEPARLGQPLDRTRRPARESCRRAR